VEITVTTETGTTTITKVCDLVFHRKGQPVGDFRKVLRRACIAAGLCVTLTDGQGKETKKATTMFHDLGGHACGTSKTLAHRGRLRSQSRATSPTRCASGTTS